MGLAFLTPCVLSLVVVGTSYHVTPTSSTCVSRRLGGCPTGTWGRGSCLFCLWLYPQPVEHLHVEMFNKYWLLIALLRYITYHAIHPFKVHNSVIFSVFARLCHCHPNSRTFSLAQKETPYPLARSPHLPAAPSRWSAFYLCRFPLMEPSGSGLVTGSLHWAWYPPSFIRAPVVFHFFLTFLLGPARRLLSKSAHSPPSL